ncbi:hypothetical protein J6590_011377 [Homalodisca vitripennis]|nr:hypothetical protein J6590_011377 [Homalodisca vitripennis]
MECVLTDPNIDRNAPITSCEADHSVGVDGAICGQSRRSRWNANSDVSKRRDAGCDARDASGVTSAALAV